jgi:hypothetical protein
MWKHHVQVGIYCDVILRQMSHKVNPSDQNPGAGERCDPILTPPRGCPFTNAGASDGRSEDSARALRSS